MQSMIHYLFALRNLFNLLIFNLQELVSSSGSTLCFHRTDQAEPAGISCTNLSFSTFVLSHCHCRLRKSFNCDQLR
jgi:hypothetical protein